MDLDRFVLVQKFLAHFFRELFRSIKDFSIDEQIDIFNTLLEILLMHKKGEDFEKIIKVAEEKLFFRYRQRMSEFSNAGILAYLDQTSLKFFEFIDDLEITDREQHLTDEEYENFLNNVRRVLLNQSHLAIISEPLAQPHPQEKETSVDDIQGRNPEHTTRRQALAIYYLSQYCGFNKGTEIALARFVQFLSGKNLDNITKILRNPLKIAPEKRKRADEELIKDLIYIRDYFDALRMANIVSLINRDINEVMKG